MEYKYFIYISKQMRSVLMDGKIDAINGKEVKKNRWQQYQDRFAQYSANFQSPNKIDIGGLLNGSVQTQNTAFGG